MNFRRLYQLGKRKHEFGFRGALLFVAVLGFAPGGVAFFAYESWNEERIAWIAIPAGLAVLVAAVYSLGIMISAYRSESDLREFRLRLMGSDPLAERIYTQAKWNPEAKEAWARYIKKNED